MQSLLSPPPPHRPHTHPAGRPRNVRPGTSNRDSTSCGPAP